MKTLLIQVSFGCLVAFFSFQVRAYQGWIAGAEIQKLSSEVDYFGTKIEFDVNTLGAIIGYQQSLSEKWSVSTSLNVGTGIKQDENNQVVIFGDILADFGVEVSTYIKLQTQFEFRLSKNGSVFVAPGVSRYDYTVKERSFNSQSFADWQLSFSGGYLHRVGTDNAIRVTYSHLSDTDVLSVGYEHRF